MSELFELRWGQKDCGHCDQNVLDNPFRSPPNGVKLREAVRTRVTLAEFFNIFRT